MLISFIKHVFIIGCSSYATYKLLNCKKIRLIYLFVFLCFFSLIGVFTLNTLQKYVPIIATLITIILSIIAHKIIYKADFYSTIVATIIAYGISYLTYLLGIALLIGCLLIVNHPINQTNLLITTIISFLQCIFTVLLFRVKRLRNGLPFLQDPKYNYLGFFLSTVVLLLVAFLRIQTELDYVTAILCCSMLTAGMFLWFWWKTRMTQKYMEELHKREQQELQKEISNLNTKIAKLNKENEIFSKIIHKDNKLIPAMELAVKESLYSVVYNDNQTERLLRTTDILTQLEEISKERAGIVSNYEHTDTDFSNIGIPILDVLFSYMLRKSTTLGIALNLKIDKDATKTIDTVISQSDISTLLADLIENAIVAVSENVAEKKILVEIGMRNEIYHIRISDNGVPFPDNVIKNWGIKRTTTHAENGGSGIGLMSTYEICTRYHASFMIECYKPTNTYRKCVSILFDGKKEFVVKN